MCSASVHLVDSRFIPIQFTLCKFFSCSGKDTKVPKMYNCIRHHHFVLPSLDMQCSQIYSVSFLEYYRVYSCYTFCKDQFTLIPITNTIVGAHNRFWKIASQLHSFTCIKPQRKILKIIEDQISKVKMLIRPNVISVSNRTFLHTFTEHNNLNLDLLPIT